MPLSGHKPTQTIPTWSPESRKLKKTAKACHFYHSDPYYVLSYTMAIPDDDSKDKAMPAPIPLSVETQ